jgi:hypothetical protein
VRLTASTVPRTLRNLYATPWNPWTLAESLDNKNGRHLKKTLKRRPHAKLF